MLIIIIILVVIAIVLLSFYNDLKRKQVAVKHAQQNIDVFLQKRLDELTSLFMQIERAFKHEKDVFTEVSKLRSLAREALVNDDYNKKIEVYNSGRRFVSERYPTLKTMGLAMHLGERTSLNEEDVAAARQVYNSTASLFNEAIATFPNSMFASLFGFTPYTLFEADVEARERVKAPYEDAFNKYWEDKEIKD